MNCDYDVVIVGGGMAGASLACALGRLALKTALIEAHPMTITAQPQYDDRVIALALGSTHIFAEIGVWPMVAAHATPIHHIHVSQKGAWGVTHLDRAQLYADALGYVAPARAIGQALATTLPNLTRVTRFTPARLAQFTSQPDGVRLRISMNEREETFSTRLLIAADGAQSTIRTTMGWGVTQHDYAQHAIICNVTFNQNCRHTAYERFHPAGPLAMLPLGERRMASIWTVADAVLDEHMALSDSAFRQRLQAQFGYRVGAIEQIGVRSCFPLTSIRAQQCAGRRVVLLGNAAHAMHPVAGQGFNLSLRDTHALVALLAHTLDAGGDIGGEALLQAYTANRAQDHRWVMSSTHALIQVFGLPGAPARWLRSLAMLGLDVTPWLKHALTLHAMGLSSYAAPTSAQGV